MRNLVGGEFIGDQHPWPTALLLQNFREEPGCGFTVPLTLDENVEDVAVLIDGPPQVFSGSTDVDELSIGKTDT